MLAVATLPLMLQRTALACALLALTPTLAQADILPSGTTVLDYTYEIANLAAHPTLTLVWWPLDCWPSEKPGDRSFLKDPEWLKQDHGNDYMVVQAGVNRSLRKCADVARLYALDAAVFVPEPRETRSEVERIYRFWGVHYLALRVLDARRTGERAAFFESDPSVRRSAMAFPGVRLVDQSSPLRSLHDVFRVVEVGPSTVTLAPQSTRYTFEDGTFEQLPWLSGPRPTPTQHPDVFSFFGGQRPRRERRPPAAPVASHQPDLPPAAAVPVGPLSSWLPGAAALLLVSALSGALALRKS